MSSDKVKTYNKAENSKAIRSRGVKAFDRFIELSNQDDELSSLEKFKIIREELFPLESINYTEAMIEMGLVIQSTSKQMVMPLPNIDGGILFSAKFVTQNPMNPTNLKNDEIYHHEETER